jgi:hypothetical protein
MNFFLFGQFFPRWRHFSRDKNFRIFVAIARDEIGCVELLKNIKQKLRK